MFARVTIVKQDYFIAQFVESNIIPVKSYDYNIAKNLVQPNWNKFTGEVVKTINKDNIWLIENPSTYSRWIVFDPVKDFNYL